ncbi:MAG: class I SAM-dependent methyltransferase, partial [Deltaproteobacteria bacterium]|nr:class I SAM-dependent methyltransferase [Deltaproteobacteria bacterium]
LVLRKQAEWCGIKPGQRLLDLGCGPGKTTAILYDLIQPGGSIVGLDGSEERISHARRRYGNRAGMEFAVHDIRTPLNGFGTFDGIWVRFVLEYYREQSRDIVRNIARSLNPGGSVFLLDLDYNCLSHHELPAPMAKIVPEIIHRLEEVYNFDAYAGRKLYAHLFDLGFENIEVGVTAHHVIYGKIRDVDNYNWTRKIEVTASRLADLFDAYPGGYAAFLTDFRNYFHDPRRFTYTPLIMVKGSRPERFPDQPAAMTSK